MTDELTGINSDGSIGVVARQVSAVPGVALEAHESPYWGDPYHGLRDTDLKLTTNADPKFEVGDAPEERWFSLAGRDCAYPPPGRA